MSVIRKSWVLASVLVGMFAGTARAQDIVTVKVPFPFVVGREAFPAGRYEIRNADESGTVIVIRGTDNKSVGFALTTAAGGRDPGGEQPVLVFTKYENDYKLSQIWHSTDEGRELPRLRGESRTARAETQVITAAVLSH
jgi:hypothetical protein